MENTDVSKTDNGEKRITWPFWIQIPTVLLLPFVYTWCFYSYYECYELLNWFYHVIISKIYSFQILLCLPVGILGLVMVRKMKKLRIATIVLSLVNLLEFVAFLVYFAFLLLIYIFCFGIG